MADNSGKKKGGAGKIGKRVKKCEKYAIRHGVFGKRRFTRSKEHRGCGPLGYKMKALAAEQKVRDKARKTL